MPKICGKVMSRAELLKKCGIMGQVAGYKRYSFSEGRAKGVEAVDINNGNGLKFTVLLDRNMDIQWCDYKGINLSYISNNNIISPFLFEVSGNEWLRGFNGGLLTTCGISYAGAGCEDNGEMLGLHGRIAACPADNVCCEAYWDKEDYIIRLSGSTYETKFFGENLVLHREIKVKAGENKIFLQDRISNLGFKKSPIMMIYHMNFGFPLLDGGSEIYINSMSSIPASKESELKSAEQYIVEAPQHGIKENVYFHEFEPGNQQGIAAIVNRALQDKGLGVYIKFDLTELPYLNQWKMMGEGEYVLGLEPSNCMTLGRVKERERGFLRYIEPGETKTFAMEIGIIEDVNEFLSDNNMLK